jgi:hypothetical protein
MIIREKKNFKPGRKKINILLSLKIHTKYYHGLINHVKKRISPNYLKMVMSSLNFGFF